MCGNPRVFSVTQTPNQLVLSTHIRTRKHASGLSSKGYTCMAVTDNRNDLNTTHFIHSTLQREFTLTQ